MSVAASCKKIAAKLAGNVHGVPGVPVLADAIVALIEACEGIPKQKRNIKELLNRCANLLEILDSEASQGQPTSKRVERAIVDANEIVLNVEKRMKRWARKSRWKRFLRSGSIDDDVTCCTADINRTVEKLLFLFHAQVLSDTREMAEHMQTIISTTSKEPGFLSQSTEGEYNVTKEMIEETQQVNRGIDPLDKEEKHRFNDFRSDVIVFNGSHTKMSRSPSDPHLSLDRAPQPSTDCSIPGPSTLVEAEVSACIRLATRVFAPHELVSLIDNIFTRKDEVKMVGNLDRNAAQALINVVHEALDLPNLPSRLRKKCLTALCWLCGRHALLPESLQIPVCYDRSDAPLYCGGFGDVWKGKHQGCPVAVKVLRVYSTSDFDKIISRFCKEVVTWSALRHPNVLPLLGVTMDTHHFAMASEWMINGNINEFVKAHRDVNRFELLEDVARGLIYMHSQAMIHGDLKGANILIDKYRHARLADFGLLTIISDPTNFTASSSHVKGGTTRWMSPEILNPEMFDFKDSRLTNESDCYALGMVVLEVLSGRSPFAPDKDFIVMRKVIDGERPGKPEGPEGAWFTDDLWRMLELCWATPPKSRPSIEAVLECLERVSGTWEPPSQQVGKDVGMNRDDLDYSIDSLYQALDPL